jgi:hypothetical protein
MATRGYLIINNPEKTEEDPYLGFREDVLVEAYHDGYTSDMLYDLVAIPERLLPLITQGYGNKFSSFILITNRDLNPEEGDHLDLLIENLVMMGSPLELMWHSHLELLHITSPFKYSQIAPGCTRYRHPVTEKSATIHVSQNGKRLDQTEIKVLSEIDGDDISIHESMRKLVDKTNTRLGLNRFPLTVKHGDPDTIVMSIAGVLLELFVQYKTQTPKAS